MKKGTSKHLTSEAMVEGRLRTFLRLLNLHWDISKGNFGRPWSANLGGLLVLLLTDRVKLGIRVQVIIVRGDVNLTSVDERAAVPGTPVISTRVSTTSSVGVGRRYGQISAKMMGNTTLKAVADALGRRQIRWVGVLLNEFICIGFSKGRFLRIVSVDKLLTSMPKTHLALDDLTTLSRRQRKFLVFGLLAGGSESHTGTHVL